MTSSEDDLSWVLRRELNAEAARLAAAQDGLSKIRAQLRSRPSVPVWGPLWGGLRVDAERYGLHARHLAAEAADWIVGMTGRIPFPGRRDRAEGRAGARPGLVWLRPVLAVAAVCIFAGTAAAIPGLRHAITNIGSSGSGRTASVTGHGGGSGLGTGHHNSPGGNGTSGGQAGATATASPSPSATCTALAKPLPKAKASPANSGGAAVSPTVTPAQSSPAAAPTTEPASPTQAPTSPTGSSGPTPTDTAGAPLSTSGPPTDSSYLSKDGTTCVGPVLKGSASAAAAGALQIPSATPTPQQTSARVEQPAVTPATSATTAPATPSSTAGSSDSDTPSATSTSSSSGSPWSQGFESAHACWHHPHAGCPSS
jgi:hypothetical protein